MHIFSFGRLDKYQETLSSNPVFFDQQKVNYHGVQTSIMKNINQIHINNWDVYHVQWHKFKNQSMNCSGTLIQRRPNSTRFRFWVISSTIKENMCISLEEYLSWMWNDISKVKGQYQHHLLILLVII